MKTVLLENGRPNKPMPCPRCHSLNTKFCYFNNYNVKQPRYLCRECQRFWTAGGSLRNVPIGAGRRKHKIGSTFSTALRGVLKATSDVLQEADHPVKTAPDSIQSERRPSKSSFWRLLPKPMEDVSVKISTLDQAHKSKRIMARTYRDSLHSGSSGIRTKCSVNVTSLLKVAEGHSDHKPKSTCAHDGTGSCFMHEAPCRTGDSESLHFNVNQASKCPASPDSAGSCKLVQTSCTVEDDNTTEILSTRVLPLSSMDPTTQPNNCKHAKLDSSIGLKAAYPDSLPALYNPFMWPWIWPLYLNGTNSTQFHSSGDVGTLSMGLQLGSNHAIRATSVNDASQMDTKGASVASAAPNFVNSPFIWNPLAWGPPYSLFWNSYNLGFGQLAQGQAKEEQGSLCIPKTLRLDRPDEAVQSSIFSTLGVTVPSHSPSGPINGFQPKADVFQPKTVALKTLEQCEHHHHTLAHSNPAAQTRSLAFQEGS
ncbi:hypothetical protein KP509_03G044500 [Ceratopteris richardii]|uniref:Dof-type domain-containing protein n=1 Tax=Ceratopteris richardii TaxID=49495 RepID=A0A8T2UZH8_CERRI|nr:hypothetical protein KP509_03G044500 [Ceratopteris richardii]